MRGISRIALTVLLSIGIAVSLTFVQGMGRDSQGDGVPVFGQKSKRLSENELVDRMAPLDLQLKMAKVDWNAPTLSVDLLLAGRDDKPGMVFDDLYELVQFGFFQTSNVQQVLVRVLEKPGESDGNSGARLLLTMDARRDQFAKHEQKTDDPSKIDAQPYLQTHSRITYTGLWNSRFGG